MRPPLMDSEQLTVSNMNIHVCTGLGEQLKLALTLVLGQGGQLFLASTQDL